MALGKRSRDDQVDEVDEGSEDSGLEEEAERLQREIDMMRRLEAIKQKQKKKQRAGRTPTPVPTLPSLPPPPTSQSNGKNLHTYAIASSQRLDETNKRNIVAHVPGNSAFLVDFAQPGGLITRPIGTDGGPDLSNGGATLQRAADPPRAVETSIAPHASDEMQLDTSPVARPGRRFDPRHTSIAGCEHDPGDESIEMPRGRPEDQASSSRHIQRARTPSNDLNESTSIAGFGDEDNFDPFGQASPLGGQLGLRNRGASRARSTELTAVPQAKSNDGKVNNKIASAQKIIDHPDAKLLVGSNRCRGCIESKRVKRDCYVIFDSEPIGRCASCVRIGQKCLMPSNEGGNKDDDLNEGELPSPPDLWQFVGRMDKSIGLMETMMTGRSREWDGYEACKMIVDSMRGDMNSFLSSHSRAPS